MTKPFFLKNEENRHQFVKTWISKLPPGARILDAGAGIQRYKKYCKHLNYTSQDFAEYEGGELFAGKKVTNWSSKNVHIVSDICNIPAASESFDFIMCTEVLEHVSSPNLAVKELARVLKNDGTLLLTIPFRSVYHQDPFFFYSGFSRYWISNIANENNLSILQVTPNGSYFTDLAQEVWRTSSTSPIILRPVSLAISILYLAWFYFVFKINPSAFPESCWGYHIILMKQ